MVPVCHIPVLSTTVPCYLRICSMAPFFSTQHINGHSNSFASMLRAVFLISLVFVVTQASVVHPIAAWPADGGRRGIRLYHGNDERMLLTRLAFSAPQTALLATTANGSTANLFVVLPHSSLFMRYDDTAKASISDAPTPRMSRTRVAVRTDASVMSSEMVLDATGVIPDWSSGSRWQAMLFLEPHSDIWRLHACWTLTAIGRALPQLILEDSTECTWRASSAQVTWPARPYMYSIQRDGIARRHGRRGGVFLIGMAHLTSPSMASEAEARELGCVPPHCAPAKVAATHRSAEAYPIIIDLESERNYLPSALHFLCEGHTHLHFEFFDSSLHRATSLPCTHGYSINMDSTEIVLGLPFLNHNYSEFTYSARESRIYAILDPPDPSMALRIVVSVLILVINGLVVVWFDARSNYATLVSVVAALDTPAGPSVLHFHARHTIIELTGIVLGAVVLGLTAPYTDPQFSVYYWTVAALWIAYALVGLVIIFVTIVPVYAALRHWGRNNIYAEAPPAGHNPSMVPMSTTLVFARHAAAMMVLLGGILLGLLLSADSVLMLVVTAFYAGLAIYYLTYYTAAAIICSVSFNGRARIAFSGFAWGTYVVFMGLTVLTLTIGAQVLLMTVVFQDLNSFYPSLMLDLLSGTILMTVIVLSVYTANNDVAYGRTP